MRTYRVLRGIELRSGNIVLDESQARARAHLLTANGDGIFAIEGRVYFKPGEIIRLGIDAIKSIINSLEDITPVEITQPEQVAEAPIKQADEVVMAVATEAHTVVVPQKPIHRPRGRR